MLGLLFFDVLGTQLLGVLLHSRSLGPLMLEPSPSQVRVSLSLSSAGKRNKRMSYHYSIQCMIMIPCVLLGISSSMSSACTIRKVHST